MLFRSPGWEFSEGSVKEVKEASNVGLCVYEFDQESKALMLLQEIEEAKQCEK